MAFLLGLAVVLAVALVGGILLVGIFAFDAPLAAAWSSAWCSGLLLVVG